MKPTKKQIERTKELIKWSKETINTNYFKVMIEGYTGIYYASPIYLHQDYNKTRVFDKTKATLKLIDLFNKEFN